MSGGFDGSVRLGDSSLRIDPVRDSPGAWSVRGVASAVREPDRSLLVAEKRKGIFELASKGGVVLDRVERDPQDLGVSLDEPLVEIAEPATLEASPGRVRLGIEPEDHVAAAIVR